LLTELPAQRRQESACRAALCVPSGAKPIEQNHLRVPGQIASSPSIRSYHRVECLLITVHLARGSTETHVEKFFAWKLGDLIRVRTCAGPAREGRSRTPSMNADEKSDEVVVPSRRSNKGGQLPAEVAEGRASPEGNSRHAAVVRTLSRDARLMRLVAVRRRGCGFQPRAGRRSTQGRSSVRWQRTPGSGGALSNERPHRDPRP
jgi:hypothetical protein